MAPRVTTLLNTTSVQSAILIRWEFQPHRLYLLVCFCLGLYRIVHFGARYSSRDIVVVCVLSKNVTRVVRRAMKSTVVGTCRCLKSTATGQRSTARTCVCWQNSSLITRRCTTTSSRFISMCWLLATRLAAISLDTSPRLVGICYYYYYNHLTASFPGQPG